MRGNEALPVEAGSEVGTQPSDKPGAAQAVDLPMGSFMNGVQMDNRAVTERTMQISWARQHRLSPATQGQHFSGQAGHESGRTSGPHVGREWPGQGRSRHLFQAFVLASTVCPGCSMSVISLQHYVNGNGLSIYQGGS